MFNKTIYYGRKIQRVSDPFKHGEEHRFSVHLCCKRLQFQVQRIDEEELVALQDVSHRDVQAQDRKLTDPGIEQVSGVFTQATSASKIGESAAAFIFGECHQ